MLIVDLRQPVEGSSLQAALRAVPTEDAYALTPIAARVLEKAGVPYKTGADIVDPDWFRTEGLKNSARIEEIFSAVFGPEKESWLGLTYEIKFILDYALGEEKRWEAAQRRDAFAICDIALESRENLEPFDHIQNRCSLYFFGLAAERFVQVRRAPNALPRGLRLLRRLANVNLREKLRDRLPGFGKPVLVTRYAYDWALYKPTLRKRFTAISAEDLARLAVAAMPAATADPRPVRALMTALSEQYTGLLPKTIEHVLAILGPRAESYATLRAQLKDALPETAKRCGVRAALATICDGHADYLVHHYLKAYGYPTVFHQHGSYMTLATFVLNAEVAPATHNFAYGTADAAFLSGFRAGQPVYTVGSARLDHMTPAAPRAGRFLYVLLQAAGNALNVEGPPSFPRTDASALFQRHRKIIDIFSRHPEKTLHIREHPAQGDENMLHEPLAELLSEARLPNVALWPTANSPDQFLSGYEGVIFDYVSTGLIEALAKGCRIACFVGPPYRIDIEGERLLAELGPCDQDEAAFTAAVERWVADGAPLVNAQARDKFLSLYGRAADGHCALTRIEQILNASQET